MTISIDFNSPVIRILGLETKYDFAGASNSFIRLFKDYLPARIIQQFHFWLRLEKGGFVIDGKKWIYKSQLKLRTEAIVGFSEYHVKKAIDFLDAEGILIRKQLHREHYGGVHAHSAYNRQYYYRIDYEALRKFLVRQIKKLRLQIKSVLPPKSKLVEHPLLDGTLESDPTESTATNTETEGLVNTANQISDIHEPDSRISQNNTNTTSRAYRSDTPPPPPVGKSGGEQEQNISNTPQSIQRRQEQGNPDSPCQKTVNPEPTPFTDVVARPPRVEQKINIKEVVQKPVQEPLVQEAVQEQQPEAVQVEVMPSGRSERKPRTRKGTQPNQDFGLAPWKSLEQFKQFYRALVKKLPIVANSRSPEGMANTIIQQLKNGVPHSYWDDFINGLPIGTSTQQEWEVEPGVPHPVFIEYLTEKLIKGNNSQTRESAILQALNIASSPKQAIFFWKECKISLGNALDEVERHRALGIKALSTPLWTKERPEPTLEEAAEAGEKIQEINSSTEAVIEAAKNRQIEGSTRSIEPSTQEAENTPLELDPWLDEEKPTQPKKPKISDFADEKFRRRMSKGFSKTKAKSTKRDARPDQWRAKPFNIENMNKEQINKALLDPILCNELRSQLMLSDYELIKDEVGRIISVEDPF